MARYLHTETSLGSTPSRKAGFKGIQFNRGFRIAFWTIATLLILLLAIAVILLGSMS